MCTVSVITPAFNAAPFLEETVRSIQAQTFPEWRLFIVDDCSTDGTHALANRLAAADARITVLQTAANSGVAAARNLALDAVSSPFVAFLDADDLWLPDKLEKQVAFMRRNHCVLSYTNYQAFDSATGTCKPRIYRAPARMTARRILGDTSIGCLTVMVNRDLSGPFLMPPLNHTEDNVAWQEILARTRRPALRLDEVLSLYREGTASLSSAKAGALALQWKTYRDYYKFSLPKSAFFFASYAVHAVRKHFF